ncbi:CDP-diacylglycerol--serine O-phosphatidyltransferase [Fodinicurvata sediminis]|uniref:CDP-diacylglycerol--serine O-phosphatidyltransferase n=1 Tax=Fodinicurvata sediminis TaxID=1121832 RepID=UPI0003B62CC7|nr:CDP-diacylglycerol--serine O-phosphatidyltransferase [Fodinicurvata sediminis]
MLNRRRNRRKQRRPQSASLGRLVPNALTVAALSSGLTAVRFAYEGSWNAAIVAILVAAILDGLDGRMARLLRATSDFGAELDSLSDVIAFGVAPAMILYFWSLDGPGSAAWVVALFYVVCVALRLARYNTDQDKPSYAYNYFTGIPSPAGAIVVLLPLVISREIGNDLAGDPLFVSGWMALIGILMVTRIPTFAVRSQRIPNRYVLPLLAAVGLITAGLAERPWWTITLGSVVYLASIPLSYRSFKRLEAKVALAEEESTEPSQQPAAEGAVPLHKHK